MQKQLNSRHSCLGVILAGGLSSRMGQDKAELVLADNTTLINAMALRLSLCDEISDIVLSRNHHQTTSQHQAEYLVLADQLMEIGPLGGIHAVYHWLDETNQRNDWDSILFLPVDMPAMSSELIDVLIREGRQDKHTAPHYFSTSIMPLYLPTALDVRQYVEEVVRDNGKRSLKAMTRYFNGVELQAREPECFINTNTPDEWQQYCHQAKSALTN